MASTLISIAIANIFWYVWADEVSMAFFVGSVIGALLFQWAKEMAEI